MPGFNGTGPRSLGPFTGKGAGYCIRQVDQELTGQAGWSRGRGRRGRFRDCLTAGVALTKGSSALLPEERQSLDGREEINLLRDQAGRLEEALEQARRRIDELESKYK